MNPKAVKEPIELR